MAPVQQHMAIQLDTASLAASRDTLTRMPLEQEIADAITLSMQRWSADPSDSTPLTDLRNTLELVRLRPRGAARVRGMNTIVRVLGKRETLATFLEILRSAARTQNGAEQQLALTSQSGKMHSIYGWCGQTTLVLSPSASTEATSPPIAEGVTERLGYPQPLWWISIHIWQPNQHAVGFNSGKRAEPDSIMEPPHSHPFDFVSMVSAGAMRQSIYERCATDEPAATNSGRYRGVTLEEVDNVWPPHARRQSTGLITVEDRILLSEGDSYFMPYHRIHDVEVNKSDAIAAPAITLFLASESLTLADVFMARSMADYHAANPNILDAAKPLSLEQWDCKLRATAEYLRGESQTLHLADIVNAESAYAFFHV